MFADYYYSVLINYYFLNNVDSAVGLRDLRALHREATASSCPLFSHTHKTLLDYLFFQLVK